VCHIPLESSWWELQLCFGPHLNWRFGHKVMGFQTRESQLWQFQDSHLGVPGQKNIWMWASWRGTKYTIKGEGGGFPQVQAMVNLMCPCCPWFVLALRVFQLCPNHFVWVVCRPVWVSKVCQLFLIPSRNSNTPLYPSKCCELGSVPRLRPLLMSSIWTHIRVLQGVGSASMLVP
jgi:hypothetical protein